MNIFESLGKRLFVDSYSSPRHQQTNVAATTTISASASASVNTNSTTTASASVVKVERREVNVTTTTNMQKQSSVNGSHSKRNQSDAGIAASHIYTSNSHAHASTGSSSSGNSNNANAFPVKSIFNNNNQQQQTGIIKKYFSRRSTHTMPSFSIEIKDLKHVPYISRGVSNTKFYVKVTLFDKDNKPIDVPTKDTVETGHMETSPDKKNKVVWNEILTIPYDITKFPSGAQLKDIKVRFTLMVPHSFVMSHDNLGYAQMTLEELAEREDRKLCIEQEGSFDLLLDKEGGNPTILRVSVQRMNLPRDFPPMLPDDDYVSEDGSIRKYEKHVMIITRGTRGDIQPFAALSVGLAEQLGWKVTLCSEMRYANNLKKYFRDRRKLYPGKGGVVKFRPTGGDTMSRVDSKIGRWALRNGHDVLQLIMMGKAEIENFPSEPVLYYWAKVYKPDLLIFGFTMASIGMILSEALKIPTIGFILQPTCIPSTQYPPLYDIDGTGEISWAQEEQGDAQSPNKQHDLQEHLTSDSSTMKIGATISNNQSRQDLPNAKGRHKLVSRIKGMLENGPFYPELNYIRTRRGLKPFSHWKQKEGTYLTLTVPTFSSKTWATIVRQNVPVIVPINEYAFGGKPSDWSDNTILTDFIYLPQTKAVTMSEKLQKFVTLAKQESSKLVLMGFSSMPISHSTMLKLGNLIITECKTHPRLIIVTGERDPSTTAYKAAKLDAEIARLEATNKVCVVNAAPFQLLFPQLDCAVIHGGLGTTADALRAGIPTIVTGVLLMDQRFWGHRVHELGVGPPPCHHSDLKYKVVEWIDHALKEDSPWAKRAKEVAEIIKPRTGDADGIQINVKEIEELAKVARPVAVEGAAMPSRASVKEVTQIVTNVSQNFMLADNYESEYINIQRFHSARDIDFNEVANSQDAINEADLKIA